MIWILNVPFLLPQFLMGRWEMPSQLDALMDVSRACSKVFSMRHNSKQKSVGQKRREKRGRLYPIKASSTSTSTSFPKSTSTKWLNQMLKWWGEAQ